MRKNFPAGKCGGSVQVQVCVVPDVVGVVAARTFCPRH
jgi:hypothetical protein